MIEYLKSKFSSIMYQWCIAVVTLILNLFLAKRIVSFGEEFLPLQAVKSTTFQVVENGLISFAAILGVALLLMIFTLLKKIFSVLKIYIKGIIVNVYVKDEDFRRKLKVFDINVATGLSSETMALECEILPLNNIRYKLLRFLGLRVRIEFDPDYFQFVVSDDSPTVEHETTFQIIDQHIIEIPFAVTKSQNKDSRSVKMKLNLTVNPVSGGSANIMLNFAFSKRRLVCLKIFENIFQKKSNLKKSNFRINIVKVG